MAKHPLNLDGLLVREGHRGFSRDTPEKKVKRMAESEVDPLKFGKNYLPHYFSKPSPKFHRELINLFLPNPRAASAAPRGHGKSTIVSITLPLWNICFQRKNFIVPVSDTAVEARRKLDAVRLELEQNKKIIEDFGNLVGERKWTESEFVTSNGIKMMAKGSGSQLRGITAGQYRPDLVIVDDFQNDQQAMSAEQRKKDYDWFMKTLSNCLAPWGQLWAVGTMFNAGLVLVKLKDNPAYKFKKFKAIQDDGSILWGDMWSRKALEKKRLEIGSIAFEAEYQNNPRDPESMAFNPDWFRYYELSHIEGIPMETFMAIDPSLGKRERGDYSAIITIGINRENMRIYVLDADISRITPRKLIDKIMNKFFRYYPIRIGIETVAFQEVLKEWLDELSREKGFYLPTTEVHHRSDKVMRIGRLSPLMERGDIYFRKDQILLLQQLMDFPKGDHDDGPDALEMAVDIARRMAIQFEIIQEPVEEGVFLI